jgi:hypothetical protein
METFAKLLSRFADAEFACGDWQNGDEQTWDEVYNESIRAQRALVRWVKEHTKGE